MKPKVLIEQVRRLVNGPIDAVTSIKFIRAIMKACTPSSYTDREILKSLRQILAEGKDLMTVEREIKIQELKEQERQHEIQLEHVRHELQKA